MIWSLVQQVGGQALNSLVFFVLAALLQPEQFGVVAMASVWIGVLSAFAESGFGAALVHRTDVSSAHLSTTFAINIVVGLGLALLGIALAAPAGAFYGNRSVEPVMAALSCGFLIRSLGLTQSAYLQRQLRFKDLAIRDLGASFAGGLAGTLAAFRGWGAWSLVVMTLVNSVASVALVWRVTSWRPRWGEMSIERARELWPYSSRILGFNGVKAIVQNSDRLVIGFLLGARAVGLYTFAFRLVVFPVRTLLGAVDAYLFPRLCRIQSDLTAVRDEYVLIMRLVLAAVIPAMVVAAFVAPQIVVGVFGQRWAPAIVPVQILTIASLAGVFYPPVGDVVKALNRPGWMMGWALLYASASCLSLWAGSYYGLAGAVWAYSLAHVALIPVVLGMVNSLVALRPRAVATQWGPSAIAGLLLALVLLGATYLGPDAAGLKLTVGALAGLGLYAVVLGRLDPDLPQFIARRLGPRLGLGRSL
jgi:PST family polysaccharide transporter